MGMVRKTLSIGTLGLVSFRSKKELLARAEVSLDDAEAALAREQEAREMAEVRVAGAGKELKRADKRPARATRSAEKASAAKRKRRERRAKHLSEALASIEAQIEPTVRHGVEVAKEAGHDASAEAVKLGRRARKQAAKA